MRSRKWRIEGPDIGLLDDERRQQPHHIVAGRDGEQLFGPQGVDQLAVGNDRAQPDEQAFAPHLGDHAGMTVLHLGEPLLEQKRDAAQALEEAGRQHHVEHGVAGRHGERIAAEGRAVRARRHALAGLRGGEEGPDRKAAAERLGERHDVGRHPGVLIGEQVAGAPHAGLHFVEDQQRAVLVGELAQLAQGLVRRHPHAPLALDGLDQDGGGGRADHALDRRDVAERHLVEALDHRSEAVEIFLLAAGRERRQRAAMERALEGDDADALGGAVDRVEFARGLDRALHRLGARIREEHVVGEALRAQPLRQPLAFRDAEQVGDMQQLGGLRGQRFHQPGMRMAERVHGDPRREVEIALARGRDQPGAFAPLEGEVDAGESRHEMRRHGLAPI